MFLFEQLGTTSLASMLGIQTPPLDGRGHIQLRELERQARELGCRSVLVEQKYVDRDYMADHSAYYASSLSGYENHCRRVHFFTFDKKRVRREMAKLRARLHRDGMDGYTRACRRFSDDAYLGFCVIKPLPGCPVGRTVLRTPRTEAGEGVDFSCTHEYGVHVCGVRLTVHGLPFQQQDLGVSACATTALWSSLHQAAEFEDITLPTPARITAAAARFTLPFGSSSSLNVDQMCQAVHATGLAPVLYRTPGLQAAQQYLFAACRSGFACVLILEDGSEESHAVTVSGMKLRTPRAPRPHVEGFDDRSADLEAVYVHDDRVGPYLESYLSTSRAGLKPMVSLPRPGTEWKQDWAITHVLIPVHRKIRLTFSALWKISSKLVPRVQAATAVADDASRTAPPSVTYDTRIVRSYRYVEQALAARTLTPEQAEDLVSSVLLSRYVGVVSLQSTLVDPIDVLVDSTSTERNLRFLAILAPQRTRPATEECVRRLARELECPAIQ